MSSKQVKKLPLKEFSKNMSEDFSVSKISHTCIKTMMYVIWQLTIALRVDRQRAPQLCREFLTLFVTNYKALNPFQKCYKVKNSGGHLYKPLVDNSVREFKLVYNFDKVKDTANSI